MLRWVQHPVTRANSAAVGKQNFECICMHAQMWQGGFLQSAVVGFMRDR
jgi:hypothetical protein